MKNNWKIIILFLWVIFSPIISAYSQKIITSKGDTLIAITPKQLSTINGIIADYEITKKTMKLHVDLLKLDSVSIVTKDSIISNLKKSTNIQSNYINSQNKSISQLNKEIEKFRRKNKLKNGIIITAAITTLGLLILK